MEQVRKSTCSHVNSLNLVTFSLTSLDSWWVGKDKTSVIAMYVRDSSSHSRYANNVTHTGILQLSLSSCYAQWKTLIAPTIGLPSFLGDIYFSVLLSRVYGCRFQKLYLWDFIHLVLAFAAHHVSIWKISYSTCIAYASPLWLISFKHMDNQDDFLTNTHLHRFPVQTSLQLLQPKKRRDTKSSFYVHLWHW